MDIAADVDAAVDVDAAAAAVTFSAGSTCDVEESKWGRRDTLD